MWGRLHRHPRDLLADAGLVDLARVLVDTAHIRAKRGGLTGRSPVDRGNPGSELHVLSDRTGLPRRHGLFLAFLTLAHGPPGEPSPRGRPSTPHWRHCCAAPTRAGGTKARGPR